MMADDRIVHVIDDDDAVRDSLAFLLEAAGLSARTYASAGRFLETLDQVRRGCVITDIRMPGMSGLELVAKLREAGSSLPILVITGHADVPLAVQAMKAGVSDFIEKPFDGEAILGAIELALRQECDGRAAHLQAADLRRRMEKLSSREREVLDGLVDGQANKTIARALDISPRTVEVYRANIMTKMQASSLSELVRMAMTIAR